MRQKETPIIKGLRTNYKQGDLLNINCSTAARDSQLKWFINDEQINPSYLIPYTGHHQINQTNSNQISALYESLPHQLNNVYYNNGVVAHALKRRTFSIQNSAITTDNNQRLAATGFRRSIISNNNQNNLNNPQSTYAHANGNLEEHQILGLQMPLLQQHFQMDVKLKCVAIQYKQVASLEQSLKIWSENQDYSRMQSSVAFAYSIVG